MNDKDKEFYERLAHTIRSSISAWRWYLEQNKGDPELYDATLESTSRLEKLSEELDEHLQRMSSPQFQEMQLSQHEVIEKNPKIKPHLIDGEILVVDDDIGMILEWHKRIYDNLDKHVITATEPEYVLRMDIKASNISMAIVDHEYKGSTLNGFDVVRHLQQNGVQTIHLCTSMYNDDKLIGEAGKIGVTSIIPKPLPDDACERLLSMRAGIGLCHDTVDCS